MSERTEVKEGMYAEDLSESERREQYELTAEDIEEITAGAVSEPEDE